MRGGVDLRAEDEHCHCAIEVERQVANVLEVVDIEEDDEGGNHLEQPLLYDAHLVLARAPDLWPHDMGSHAELSHTQHTDTQTGYSRLAAR